MLDSASHRVGYVVKRYPRYSETFIVNEILAHEAAGWEIDVYALRPPTDTHFQDCISRVRAAVHYLPHESVKGQTLWSAMQRAAEQFPRFWELVARHPAPSAQILFQSIQLALQVKNRGLQHLHAHFATSATDVALLAAELAEVPVSFTAHAKDIFHETVCADDLRQKLDRADTVVTVSDFNLRYLREGFDGSAQRVDRIYNGLDLSRFPYSSPQTRTAKIVAVGRLVEKKGFDYLLHACRRLLDLSIDFHCDILGSGECEPALRRLAAELDLEGVVRFLGSRPQSEVIDAVQQAAVMAAPCVVGDDGNRDGLPTVLLEAMALGTPCVATDVTGIPEIIHDGQTGILVDQRDAGALAAGLAQLLSDANLRVTLAEQARAVIEREFDIQRNSEKQRQRFCEPRRARPELQEV